MNAREKSHIKFYPEEVWTQWEVRNALFKKSTFWSKFTSFFKFSQNFYLQSIKLNKRSKFPPNPVSNVAKYHWASLKYLGFMAKSVF